MALSLSFSALSFSARAAPPLVPAADLGDLGLEIWFQEGALLVSVPGSEGRTAWYPLLGTDPVPLPADLSAWSPVGRTCTSTPAAAVLGTRTALAEVVSVGGASVVRVRSDAETLAENTLGRPVKVCEIRMVQADALPGLEVVVAWRFGEGAAEVRGLSLYRVPRTAE